MIQTKLLKIACNKAGNFSIGKQPFGRVEKLSKFIEVFVGPTTGDVPEGDHPGNDGRDDAEGDEVGQSEGTSVTEEDVAVDILNREAGDVVIHEETRHDESDVPCGGGEIAKDAFGDQVCDWVFDCYTLKFFWFVISIKIV